MSSAVRAIPAAAFWAPWFTPTPSSMHGQLSAKGAWLPHATWAGLSAHAQAVCQRVPGTVAPVEESAMGSRRGESSEVVWWSAAHDLAAFGGTGTAPTTGPGSGEQVSMLDLYYVHFPTMPHATQL